MICVLPGDWYRALMSGSTIPSTRWKWRDIRHESRNQWHTQSEHTRWLVGRRLRWQNGWGIKPVSENMEDSLRDAEESRAFYEILQDQVIPLYYDHSKFGYSADWVRMAKNSMVSLLPRYGTGRMVGEYVQKFYAPASRQGTGYSQDNFAIARSIAAWKARINAAWDGVSVRRLDTPGKQLEFGSTMHFKLAVKLNGLQPEDVVVELLLSRQYNKTRLSQFKHFRLECTGPSDRTNISSN